LKTSRRGRTVVHAHLRTLLADRVGGEIHAIAVSLKKGPPGIPSDLLAEHVVGTFILVLNWWVDTRSPLSPREVDELYLTLVGPVLAAAAQGCPAMPHDQPPGTHAPEDPAEPAAAVSHVHHAHAEEPRHTHGAHAGHAGPHESGQHDKHAGHSVEMFRQKFWGTLALSIPTIVWAPMIQHWFHYEAPGGLVASRWIPAVFGTAVVRDGGREVRDRLPGMMTLISLAISVAFVFSLAVTFGFPGSDLWWELATLVTIMVLGHWIEMRSISQAQGALNELAKLLPDEATRVVGER